MRADEELRVLAGWRPAIGRGRSTGGGRARLRGISWGTIDPSGRAGMRIWLANDGAKLVDAVATTAVPIPDDVDDQPWLEAEFHIEDALLVGDPRPTGAATSRTRGGQPIMPGSAWKGIIRSRVEYILRSVHATESACGRVPGCGTCRTCEVFGHPGQRGLLAFTDSVIRPVDPETPLEPVVRTQVGIDRVTGGSCDGLLFQTAPLTTGRLRLRIDALGPVAPWVRTAIDHVLCDLDDGLIGIGSRVTRGMGTVRLASQRPSPGPVILPSGTAGLAAETNRVPIALEVAS